MQPAKPSFGMPSTLWTQRREASLNWLALGLLLAAWNAVDDRPEPLRGYPCITVRSLHFSSKGHKSFNEL